MIKVQSVGGNRQKNKFQDIERNTVIVRQGEDHQPSQRGLRDEKELTGTETVEECFKQKARPEQMLRL